MEMLNLFRKELEQALAQKVFVKLSLGNYQGDEAELKQVFVKAVLIKGQEMLSFTYRYKTKDIHKNHVRSSGLDLIAQAMEQSFKIATLFNQQQEIIFEYDRKGKLRRRERLLTQSLVVNRSHDRSKNYLVNSERPYLNLLGLTDHKGEVLKHAQDKFKQINHYLSLLDPLLRDLPAGAIRKVSDMGAGKGYLTFALYDYLSTTYGKELCVEGVEQRSDLVKLCNSLADGVGFKRLHFVEKSIQEYDAQGTDLLIALHACDTATDDAIAKGIKAGSRLIVVAPCCHKQIRRQLEKSKVQNQVSFLTKYGIFLERQAEMITDGMRALLLEYFGYKTKILEFVSDVHTPKNVMIVAVKAIERASDKMGMEEPPLDERAQLSARQEEIRRELERIKTDFGIQYHYLERLLVL